MLRPGLYVQSVYFKSTWFHSGLEAAFRSLLSFLLRSGAFRLLAPEFHHEKHQSIRRDGEQGCDTSLEGCASAKVVLFFPFSLPVSALGSYLHLSMGNTPQ